MFQLTSCVVGLWFLHWCLQLVQSENELILRIVIRTCHELIYSCFAFTLTHSRSHLMLVIRNSHPLPLPLRSFDIELPSLAITSIITPHTASIRRSTQFQINFTHINLLTSRTMTSLESLRMILSLNSISILIIFPLPTPALQITYFHIMIHLQYLLLFLIRQICTYFTSLFQIPLLERLRTSLSLLIQMVWSNVLYQFDSFLLSEWIWSLQPFHPIWK